MVGRRLVSLTTATLFVFVTATWDVRAAAASTTVSHSARTHAVSSAQLHQSVLTSHAQVEQSREAMTALLNRPEVRREFQRVGLNSDRVVSTIASLSDSELVRLHQQVMTADLQGQTAGLSTGAIVAIVLAGVGGLILLTWLLIEAAEEEGYYYY